MLRSYIDHFLVPSDVVVLYTYTNDFYKRGYDLLRSEYKDRFRFVKETDFKKNIIDVLDTKFKFFTSLGDDVVVVRRLDTGPEFDFYNDPKILALNYRMGPNVTVVFQGREEEHHPVFVRRNVWNWVTAKYKNWHYPMAMMGQFYRMADLIKYVPSLNFNNPTSFETSMVQKPFLDKPLMMCMDDSKIIELALNRVQTASPTNKAGNIPVEKLNEFWLSGKRLKKESIYRLPEHINRFYDVTLEFEDR
jgi:hypothetical protein